MVDPKGSEVERILPGLVERVVVARRLPRRCRRGWGWIKSREPLSDRIDQVGIHYVRRSEVLLCKRIHYPHRPRESQKLAEIALQHLRSGNVRQRGDLLGPARAFVAGKKERLVVNDGSAERSAELILLERGGRRIPRREIILRVKNLVAQKLEGRTMEGVAAGFRRYDDLAAGVASVFGREHAGKNLELLDRIHRRTKGRRAQKLVVIDQAVQGEIVI